MAAGEDQTKAVIGNFVRVIIWLFDSGPEFVWKCLNLFFKSRLATDAVDSFVLGGLNDPGARRFWNALARPLVHSGCKCFLGRLFGEVEVAEQADEGGQNAPPIGAVNCFNGGVCVREHA